MRFEVRCGGDITCTGELIMQRFQSIFGVTILHSRISGSMDAWRLCEPAAGAHASSVQAHGGVQPLLTARYRLADLLFAMVGCCKTGSATAFCPAPTCSTAGRSEWLGEKFELPVRTRSEGPCTGDLQSHCHSSPKWKSTRKNRRLRT